MRKNYPAFSDAQSSVYSAFRFVLAMRHEFFTLENPAYRLATAENSTRALHSRRRVLDRDEREKMRREKTRRKK